MKYLYLVILIIKFVTAFDKFIVGGSWGNIARLPHVALLFITKCKKNQSAICGSSIVNQNVLLTAAHCFDDFVKACRIYAFVGSNVRFKGVKYKGAKHRVHQNYKRYVFANDIALVLLNKKLVLGSYVKRVILATGTPYMQEAVVSGWGIQQGNVYPQYLKQTTQKLWSWLACHKELGNMPEGTICGGEKQSNNHPDVGDSGGGLLVRGFMQVGIVSFRKLDTSSSLTVYTEVAFFHNWIISNMNELQCS